MDLLELGNLLPILFVTLAGIIVAMARRLETTFSGRAEAQRECAEEIATLKDAVRGANFRSKHLKLSLDREKERLGRAITMAKYYRTMAATLRAELDKNSRS